MLPQCQVPRRLTTQDRPKWLPIQLKLRTDPTNRQTNVLVMSARRVYGRVVCFTVCVFFFLRLLKTTRELVISFVECASAQVHEPRTYIGNDQLNLFHVVNE